MSKNVHTEYCCKHHGCKYNDPNCPVVLMQQEQSFPCEDCECKDIIRIELTYDEYDCEDCGGSYAEGADVYLNGILWFQLTPVANCFNCDNWAVGDVYAEIMARLGYEVELIC